MDGFESMEWIQAARALQTQHCSLTAPEINERGQPSTDIPSIRTRTPRTKSLDGKSHSCALSRFSYSNLEKILFLTVEQTNGFVMNF
jgi:hypothetical protein